MAGKQLMLPANRAFDSNGFPEAGATVKLYKSGTTTPANFYSDAALTISLGSTLVANAAGRIITPAYQDKDTPFRIKIFDAAGDELDDIDPYYFGAFYGASVIGTGLTVANSRIDLAAIATPVGAVHVKETGREGIFTWDSSNNSSSVATDTSQGVYVAPATDVTGASGAWIRTDPLLTPKMFGAVGDGTTDDTSALNAFFAFAAAHRNRKYFADGDYAVGSGVIIDGGTYGTDLTFAVDFGQCRITALNAIQKMVTIQDCAQGKFTGQLHIRGTNFISDTNTAWTCDVGLYLNNTTDTVLPDLFFEGFSYAGIDFGRQPSSNNSVIIDRATSKRIGSGMPLASRSRTGTYSGAVNTGPDASPLGSQYTDMTVTNLPPAYCQDPTLFQLLLEINGRAYFVTDLNAGASTVRIFPKLLDAELAGGSYIWHYGGVVVIRGNDSNIGVFGSISGVAVSTAIEYSCLYAPVVRLAHAEASGSTVRIGATPATTMFGGEIGALYSEGNTFNVVAVSPDSVPQFRIGALQSQSGDFSKWKAISTRYSATTYAETPWTLRFGSDYGEHKRRRAFDVSRAGIEGTDNLDFNQPRTFEGLVYRSNQFTDDFTFTLIAPNPDLMKIVGYKAAQVTLMGRGTAGKATGAAVFTPPTGHTINGGAASAAYSIPGNTYSGPFVVAIEYDGATGWTINAVPQGGIAAGDLTITGKYITATSSPASALAGNKAVFGFDSTFGAYIQGKTGGFYGISAFTQNGNLIFRNANDSSVNLVFSGDGAFTGTVTGSNLTGQMSHQANSTASDVAGMVSDFNALLAKLQAVGLMA